MSSARVAELGYQGWRQNRRVVITGARNAVMANLAPLLPRRLLLAAVHYLQSPP
jgi:short-subunit dehydrogenase